MSQGWKEIMLCPGPTLKRIYRTWEEELEASNTLMEKDNKLIECISHFTQLLQQIQEDKAYEPPQMIIF